MLDFKPKADLTSDRNELGRGCGYIAGTAGSASGQQMNRVQLTCRWQRCGDGLAVPHWVLERPARNSTPALMTDDSGASRLPDTQSVRRRRHVPDWVEVSVMLAVSAAVMPLLNWFGLL